MTESNKSVYFIRHGQATHNVGFDLHGESAYLSEEYINAPLTTKGIDQAQRARTELKNNEIELIFTSPLQRTIETTMNIFQEDGVIGVPVIALDELREIDQTHPCNRRENKTVIAAKYPMINVDRLTESDEYYSATLPEDRYERLQRILMEAKEKQIAVVSHHDALMQFLEYIGHPQTDGIQNCQIIRIEM